MNIAEELPSSSPTLKVVPKTTSDGGEGRELAVIFDLDGCIALLDAVERPADWLDVKLCSKYYRDVKADPRMVLLTHQIYAVSLAIKCKMILCTARPEFYRIITKTWLSQNNVKYDYLLMRPANNVDSDWMVKDQWRQRICTKYNIWFVVEDRPSVVKMWRDNGILCLQCNEGY